MSPPKRRGSQDGSGSSRNRGQKAAGAPRGQRGAGTSRTGRSGSGAPPAANARRTPARAQPGLTPAPRRSSSRRPVPVDAAEQVEGRQAVRELLRAGRRRVHHLTMADSSAHSGMLDEIVALAEEAGIPIRWVGRDRIESQAVTDAAQGVVAVADPVPEASIEDLVARSKDGPAPFLVVLDGVTDPHNVGAVMRSALSAGATGMVVGRHRAAGLSPTAVKAAAGAVEWLPVAPVAGIPAALAELREAGVWTVGLDADGDRPLWGLEVATEPVALVLGAEGAGLSRLVRQRCEVVASIPMQGPLASLNVSAAAALACFEVSRRRTAG